MYTTSVFFANLPFQTHDHTQPTKNPNSRPTTNPTHGSTQPMDNSV